MCSHLCEVKWRRRWCFSLNSSLQISHFKYLLGVSAVASAPSIGVAAAVAFGIACCLCCGGVEDNEENDDDDDDDDDDDEEDDEDVGDDLAAAAAAANSSS